MSNDYEQSEIKIKENVDSVIAIYFKDFLNKFDSIFRLYQISIHS